MDIVDTSIKRPVLVSMVLIALMLFGVIAYKQMSLSLLPTVKTPYVTVQTIYAGASPEVIENQITKKVEDQVSAISDLDAIQSYSMDSASLVVIQFKQNKDENVALQEVKEKVEAIQADLPDDAQKPVITKMDVASMSPVMDIVVKGDLEPTALYQYASEDVSQRLSRISGVGSITISGGKEREIQVQVNPTAVYEHGTSLTQIAGIVARANMDLPGGNLSTGNRDVPVQLKGTYPTLDDLRDLDIPTKDGIFKLHQLAEVKDTSKKVRNRTSLLDNTKGTRDDDVIVIQVIKNPSGNTVDVVDGVTEALGELEQDSDGHVSFDVIHEDKTYVRNSVNDTLSNVYMSVLLTGLVILLFLHDWRQTLIVALAMPFSIICTFFCMKLSGFNLNLVTLMGITSSTGTLVANSIVVLESISSFKAKGLDRVSAAAKGTKAVITAVFASTLTNIAVFFPLGTALDNAVAPVLMQLSYTIIYATIFSIVVSFTLTPMMASRILPEQPGKPGLFGRAFDKAFGVIQKGYTATLRAVVSHKATSLLVIAASVVAFVFTLDSARGMGYELMPKTDSGKIGINVSLPQGNDLEATAKVFRQIEDRLGPRSEVRKIETVVGNQGMTNVDVSVGMMTVYLVDKAERDKSTMQLAQEYTDELAGIPGADISVSSLSDMTISGVSMGLDLFLAGDNLDTLNETAGHAKAELEKIPGLSNITLSSKAGKRELDVTPDRKALSADGVTVYDLAMALRGAVDGLQLTTYKENNNEYDIRVELAGTSMQNVEDVRTIPVVTPRGTYPLEKYATVEFGTGTNMILRSDKKRTVEITADVLSGYALGTLQSQAIKTINAMDKPADVTLQMANISKIMDSTVRGIVFAFVLAVILVYMLLAATLENIVQPLFILMTIPLSIIGVILSVRITGVTVNIVAMVGIIMLVGIVVNNGILILDQYNQNRTAGMEPVQAMSASCDAKFRAVIMSNLAIVLGMLPMAMGIGDAGAEMRIPMGVIIVGGIISSTVLTLYVIPAMERMRMHTTRARKAQAKEAKK